MTDEKREGIGGRGKKRGFERAVVSLTPEQVESLREEAMHRMVERKVGRMDTGEVVREAVDRWTQARAKGTVGRAYEMIDEALADVSKQMAAKETERARASLSFAERLQTMLDDLLGPPPESIAKSIERSKATIREALDEMRGTKKGGRR